MTDPDSYFQKAEDVNFMINEEQKHHPLRMKIWYEVNKMEADSVLECGCNVALDSKLYEQSAIYYSGRDIQEKYLTKARELNPLVFVLKDDIRHLDINDSTYDVVYCKDVLEHLSVQDVIPAIHQMWRVAKKGICLGFFHIPLIGKDEIKIHDAGFWDNTYDYNWLYHIITNLPDMKAVKYDFSTMIPPWALFTVHK